MKQHLRIIRLIALASVLVLSSFSPIKKYLKKAEKELDKGHIKESKENYRKALEIEPENYQANLSLGLVLCELQDNYKDALPYLEKACLHSTKDTLSDLKYALAKCYQVTGDFDKSLYYLRRLDGLIDYDNEIDFPGDIQKRIADCNYSIAHQSEISPENIYIVNAGKRINTEMPEYVPIIAAQSGLIFTSKRQDNSKEEINYLDGKYFESIYISVLDSNRRYTPARYGGLDKALKTKFGRKHESLLSLTSNGNKLFVFADNKIFEIEMDGLKVKNIKKLGKTINFQAYQNHAFLSQDGKTIYFTSDAGGGKGGKDIYFSTQNSTGDWDKPQSLGDSINTAFDEEAPFLSNDEKTLYFSSKGLPGYGNFDMYKCVLRSNGKWSAPVNLGKPYNTSANDLFFVNDSAQTCGFLSSARLGGFGDMDIYKIIYTDKIDKRCVDTNTYPILLSVVDENAKDYANSIKTFIPPGYKVLDYEWRINNNPVQSPINILENDYHQDGTYKIGFKVVAVCDTCVMPVVSCSIFKNKIEKEIEKPVVDVNAIQSNTSALATNTAIASNSNSVVSNTTEGTSLNSNTSTVVNTVSSSIATIVDKGDNGDNRDKDAKKAEVIAAKEKAMAAKEKAIADKEKAIAESNKAKTEKEALLAVQREQSNKNGNSRGVEHAITSNEEMQALGFINEDILFEKNSSNTNSKPNSSLAKNAEILKNNRQLSVEILGYADTTVFFDYDKTLSEDRAHRVWVYLLKNGIKWSQIKLVKGLGPIKPDGSCGNDKDCVDKQNQSFRKVVIKLYSKS